GFSTRGHVHHQAQVEQRGRSDRAFVSRKKVCRELRSTTQHAHQLIEEPSETLTRSHRARDLPQKDEGAELTARGGKDGGEASAPERGSPQPVCGVDRKDEHRRQRPRREDVPEEGEEESLAQPDVKQRKDGEEEHLDREYVEGQG